MPDIDTVQVDDSIKTPRYMQVYSTLYQWVAQGHYSPGAPLEPEKRLCEMFGVSRITVRKALEMLAAEGLTNSVQGKGNFVRQDYVNTALRGDMNARISTARKLAKNSTLSRLRIEQVASDSACSELKIPAGTLLHHVSYIRELDDTPVGFVESWFPTDLTLTFDEAAVRRSTMLTILEDQGLALSGIDHLVGATLADEKLARMLRINVGAPLVRVRMLMLDDNRRAVQSVLGHFRADRYEHHMLMTRTLQEPQP